jgi:soluble lytic murein transglycosylase
MPADLPVAEVRAFYDRRAPLSPYGAERYADALAERGQETAARSILRHAWLTDDFPNPEAETRFLERYGHLLRDGLHRRRLERLLWQGKVPAAERQARRLGPEVRALTRARIKLARMAPGVDRAIDAVPAELRDHPGLVFERARWRMRKGRYADTVELLDPPRPEAPYPQRWWPLRHWAARTALDRGDISLAYRIAANHGLEQGLGFAQGEWLAGWIALRWLRDPATAYPHFEQLYRGVTTPVSRARAAYWAGRAAAAEDRPVTARQWYRTAATALTTFYGQLAAHRLDGHGFPALPDGPQPDAAAAMAFARLELVQAVRRLDALGQAGRVDPFLKHLTDRLATPARAQMTADLAAAVGRPGHAVRIAREARRTGIILPDHLYPVVDLPHTPAGAEQESPLVLAVARQESGFDPQAVSTAGARGIMQLMPATAEQMARQLGIDADRHSLSEPAYNLRLGSGYLRRLLRRYDGSTLLAVTAYNAGPTRVNAWLKRYGDPRDKWIDPVDWVETLPIAETRNYVQRVFESLMIYRHRLAPTEVAVALDDRLRLEARVSAADGHGRL